MNFHLSEPVFLRNCMTRRLTRSADRPINIEAIFVHALPNLPCKRSSNSSSSFVQGPSRRLGSRKFSHLSRHCFIFRLHRMPFDANCHVLASLEPCLNTICRSCSSSSADHLPFFVSLISGLTLINQRWRHFLLLRVPTYFAIATQFGSPYISTPSCNLLSSSFDHMVNSRFFSRLTRFDVGGARCFE